MHEWEVRTLKESAEVMEQSERDEKKKYFECAVVMVQSEHEEEQKYVDCAVVMLQSERDEGQKNSVATFIYVGCVLAATTPTPLLVTNLCV
jgi:hypothetical protein